MDSAMMIESYIRLRNRKTEIEARHKEELRPVRDLMAKLEAKMLESMAESGLTQMKGPGGTAYRTTRTSATVADREAFRRFILAEDAWDMADIRAAKAAITAYKEEFGELPPGVNWREELGVNFRQS